MNSLVDFIERLGSEPYYLGGSYWAAARDNDRQMPVECDCEFTREDMAIVVDGRYRLRSEGVHHSFQFRLPFEDALRPVTSIQLSTPTIGTVSGKMFFLDNGISFLTRTESVVLSARLIISERGNFAVTGVIETEGRSFGYSLRGGIASDRATLSNVVGIRQGR